MDVMVYVGLFVVTAGYAWFLNSEAGRRFATDQTWASVVVGTLLVLGALAFLIPQEALLRVGLAFVVGGIPMIVRSLWNKQHG